MKKIAIISYYASDLTLYENQLKAYDIIIAADSGINSLAQIDMRADICIGDFDSAVSQNLSFANQLIQLSTDKDETDTKAAINHAYHLFEDAEVHVFTTMSGRMDQQFGLLSIYYDYIVTGKKMKFFTEQGEILMLQPGNHSLDYNQERYFSCFAFGKDVLGLTVSGARYNLEAYDLKVGADIGCSNEFIEKDVHISFKNGVLLVYLIKREV